MEKEDEMKLMLVHIKAVVDAIAKSTFHPASFQPVITTLGFLGSMAETIQEKLNG